MRIGIIGAGISGLTAAHVLLKKGYNDICVMDEHHEVGGKCHTLVYQGKTYEMGAIMGLASHVKLQALMKRFHIKPSGVPLTRGHYKMNGQLAAQLTFCEREAFVRQLERLPQILEGYPWLETVGFSQCPEDLRQPFSVWCQHHQLDVLMKIYEQCFTTFGFGDLEKVPAAYVLKTITFDNLMGFLEISRVITWSKGTGALLHRMADTVPELRLTQPALSIKPDPQDGQIHVTLSSGPQRFDRLIYAADLTRLPQLMELPPPLLQHICEIQWEDFCVYAFKLKGLPELCGYVPENLRLERRGHLTIWYRRWPSEDDQDMVTVYAYADPALSEEERLQLIIADLYHLGCSEIQLYQSKLWKHFPHLNSDALSHGFYDLIESLQGTNGIYYTGEFLSGPNLENCVAYSEQLIHTYF